MRELKIVEEEIMRSIFGWVYVFVLTLVFASPTRAAIFLQPPGPPLEGNRATNDIRPSTYQRVADDVVFSTTVEITTVAWWGYLIQPLSNGSIGVAPPIEPFVLRIYADASTATKDIPAQFWLPIYNDELTATIDVVGDGPGTQDTLLKFTVELPEPLIMNAGERLWFSPMHNAPDEFSRRFTWQFSDDRLAEANALDGCAVGGITGTSEQIPWIDFPGNFTLELGFVPEPSVLAPAVLGCAMLMRRRRER